MRVLKKELWPVKVLIPIDEFDGDHYHIECWLGERLGVFKDRWNFVPCSKGVHYYFRNSKDATMFVLKWS
jgi:hypothetical protein